MRGRTICKKTMVAVAVAVAVAVFKSNVHAADIQAQTELRAIVMKTADKSAERGSPKRATDVRRLGFGVKASGANVSTTTQSSVQASNAVVSVTKRENTLPLPKNGTDEWESFLVPSSPHSKEIQHEKDFV